MNKYFYHGFLQKINKLNERKDWRNMTNKSVRNIFDHSSLMSKALLKCLQNRFLYNLPYYLGYNTKWFATSSYKAN